MKREICGTCKFNKFAPEGSGLFYCDNNDSDMYGIPSEYDDSCEDWEEKE